MFCPGANQIKLLFTAWDLVKSMLAVAIDYICIIPVVSCEFLRFPRTIHISVPVSSQIYLFRLRTSLLVPTANDPHKPLILRIIKKIFGTHVNIFYKWFNYTQCKILPIVFIMNWNYWLWECQPKLYAAVNVSVRLFCGVGWGPHINSCSVFPTMIVHLLRPEYSSTMSSRLHCVKSV